jgi:NAD(P)H-flavin reductase
VKGRLLSTCFRCLRLNSRLDEFTKQNQKLKVFYTLTNPTESWTGLTGRIDKAKISEYLPKPGYFRNLFFCGLVIFLFIYFIILIFFSIASFILTRRFSTQILVCGPIAMTNAMELLLNDVGHADSNIHLFL